MQKKRKPRVNYGALFALPVIAVFIWAFIEGGPDQNPWRLLLPFLAVVVLMGASGVVAAQSRTKMLQRLCGELGLQFTADGPTLDPGQLGGLTSFQGIDNPRAENVMSGRLAGAEALVFDHSYRTRQINPGSSISVSETMALFRFPGGAFPRFELSREGFLKDGYQDIDFASHALFSKRFQLRGDDESAVRKLFDGRVLEFFESRSDDFKETIEGGGEYLVVYRSGRIVSAGKLKAFIEEAIAVASALGSATTASRTV